MAIFRKYVAPPRDLFLVFAACAFPIFAWSIVMVLHNIPSLVLLPNSLWDFIGVIAYVQMFALLETTLVFLALVFLGAILPARFLRDHFVTLAGTLALGFSGGAILIQVLKQIGVRYFSIMWLADFLIWTGVFYVLSKHREKFETPIYSVIERLSIVSSVYISVGILSVIIVIVRNL